MKKLMFAVLLMPLLAFAEPNKVVIFVDGLSCPFCAGTIEKQVKSLPAVESMEISLKTGKLEVIAKEGKQVDKSKVEEAVVKAGFSVRKDSTE